MSDTLNRGAAAPPIIELHCEDREGRVRVVLPDRHVMVMPIEAAVQACGAFKDQIVFSGQFQLLLDRLAGWIQQRRPIIESAYLTVRDAGLLFVVVRKDHSYDSAFEDQLTDLDLEIANDPDYSLIRLNVLTLPCVSQESVRSFLAAGNTFKYQTNG
jgi:hypothetical protein